MIRKIRNAAVIGAGIMGGGIAALLAGAGIKTLLLDIVPSDLKEKEKKEPSARNRIVKTGLDSALLAKPPLFMQFKDAERITIGNLEDDFEKLSTCDWIVEVVVENLEIKRALFERIEAVKKPGAIVSSNTSGIPLQAMSEGRSLEFRQHFMGTHFFNPVRYMHLLELIPGKDTLFEILAFMARFGERILGKGIVWAKDTPSFIGNRIGIQGIMKVMHLMQQEGLSIPEVDALFGEEVGRPRTAMFRLVDLVGLDTLGHVAKNMARLAADESEKACFALPDFVEKMLEKRLLGQKTNAGFYKSDLTPEMKKIRKVIDPSTLEYEAFSTPQFPCLEAAKRAGTLPEKLRAVVYGTDRGAQFAWKVLADGLIYAADRIPEIADTLVDIDNAMKWGFNFEMGPFEQWDAIGVAESVEKMKAEGFAVPEKVTRMLEAGNPTFYKTENGVLTYYDFLNNRYRPVPVDKSVITLNLLKQDNRVVKQCGSASLIDLGDGVFCCEFHSKMNAVNQEIVEFMGEGLEYVDDNGIGLVIGNQSGGMPGAFCAGGDLVYMGGLAKAGKFSEIDTFLKLAQDGLQKARYAAFPIVAAPYGMTLGGGCEICLSADKIIAHCDLFMGLVEIGVGLLPAGGGCLNLWKKFVETIPEPVAEIDLAKFFVPVFMNIAMAKVSGSAADARASGFLGPKDRIVFNRNHLIGEAKKDVLKMVDEGYTPPVEHKIKVLGQAAQGMIEVEIYNMLQGKFISDYDAFLAKRIAYVISGGQVRENSMIDEAVILKLEREAFLDFWKEPKTQARVEHMLKTGKPLRN